MTGMSDVGWKAAADAGAHVSIAAPIEMHMRHGMPPIQKVIDLGMSASLSSDVECTMSADMFTQMRGVLTLQRMLANELALQGKDYPKLMTSLDALKLATVGGAKGLRLDRVTGSLTPGKEADIVLLDARALNVAPLNNAVGAIVTLMDRSNVSTVLCAGVVKKWRGALLDYDVGKLRAELEASRDYVFGKAGFARDLFQAWGVYANRPRSRRRPRQHGAFARARQCRDRAFRRSSACAAATSRRGRRSLRTFRRRGFADYTPRWRRRRPTRCRSTPGPTPTPLSRAPHWTPARTCSSRSRSPRPSPRPRRSSRWPANAASS